MCSIIVDSIVSDSGRTFKSTLDKNDELDSKLFTSDNILILLVFYPNL